MANYKNATHVTHLGSLFSKVAALPSAGAASVAGPSQLGILPNLGPTRGSGADALNFAATFEGDIC